MVHQIFGIASISAFLAVGAYADECKVYYEGCGSCVADGLKGSLRHNADCTTSCDKVCGNDPAGIGKGRVARLRTQSASLSENAACGVQGSSSSILVATNGTALVAPSALRR